ncbi:MAG: hypothetical protein J5601_02010 [Elusimicrobiaceae bacterium]|nr:hypothetical protein [Elusimicrobiaceae bacterium]
MDTKFISEVTEWMRQTDLAEFCYEKDGDSIEIKTQEALPEPAQFNCSLTPVTAPAIGIYRMAEKGKNLILTEGQFIQKGAKLGIIETVSKEYKITAPVSGKLRFASAEQGKAVEFGLPLFFIES